MGTSRKIDPRRHKQQPTWLLLRVLRAATACLHAIRDTHYMSKFVTADQGLFLNKRAVPLHFQR